ncbi:MAG: adenosylcobalamin-dependent ribonucleoside-diphosphate reductase [Anaerolineales bacterium]
MATPVVSQKSGLLPTPPLPADLPPVELTDNARQVLARRYVRRGQDGNPAESVEEMFWRVAYHVAKVEEGWNGDAIQRAREFYVLLGTKKFFPNSPTFTGAGTPLGQLAACFVLPISDDMGRHTAGIFQTLRDAALIQQTGGGNGFNFSRLRPQGAIVNTSAGQATGPVGFLRVYDHAFGEIAQGGCLLPETLVFTSKGLLRLDELVKADQPGWQEHELEVATDDGWRASSRGYNNGVAPVLRVHTRQGLSLAGTYQHRVKVMTDDGPQWRTLEALRPGDWVLVQTGQLNGKMQALRQPARKHGNQAWPTLPSILDEELAFFAGYLIGDGFIAAKEDDHRVGVSVAHSSYLMLEIPEILKRLFGVNVIRQQKENDRSVTFVVDNRAVKEFLQINGLDKARSSLASVPRLIRQSPPQIVGAFLRGLFEADGSLSCGYPDLTTTSARLAEEVATLLIGLGCPVRVRSVTPGANHYGKAAIYHVRVESTVGLQAWRDKIGCDIRSRFVACLAWESDTRRESTYVLPHPRYWVQPVLDAITLEQVDAKGRGMDRKFRSTHPNLRRSLLRYMRDERNFTLSAFENLANEYEEFAHHAVSPQGKWFVQVVGIESAGEAPTLDLEVEQNHTYLAYGMVTHNTRRGANMGVMRVDHPDVEDFITSKTSENAITNFNISVGITDAFMQAVKDDKDWDLVFPDIASPEYYRFSGTLEQAREAGVPIRVYKTLRARDLFNKIVTQAHHNGEPGMLFLDAANRANPVPHLYPLESTNPCGEQWLGPYENCCLGSVNLAQHFGPDGAVDWETLRESVVLSTRFLDDVVEANAYVPAVPQLRKAAHRARRIGLGIMGLADLMYHVGVRYGSPEGQEFAAQVMEFVRYHSMKTSVEMAEERGAFPAIEGSIYDPDNLKWSAPKSIVPFEHDWQRPAIDWDEIVRGIKKHGIRNAAQTTVAPTGTIATVAGCEGYGCEPVFALAYIRHVNDNGKDLKLTYGSPLFEAALEKVGVTSEARQKIFEEVMKHGTVQSVESVPAEMRRVFATAGDVTAEEHVRMAGALQAFVDNSISKTINFPEGATEADVATAYMLSWELGAKGITVYVTGSRDKVVLETRATADKKQADGSPAPAESGGLPASTASKTTPLPTTIWHGTKKPRPRTLHGETFTVETPLGKAFITVNTNGGNQPFEVFINTAKAGSEVAAVSEAIGRLISYILRLASPVAPIDRLREIVTQLTGIGGGRSLGFGPKRVRSLADGVGQVLGEYLGNREGQSMQVDVAGGSAAPVSAHAEAEPGSNSLGMKIGDLCPECGEAAVVNEEGCRKCYACAFSEC